MLALSWNVGECGVVSSRRWNGGLWTLLTVILGPNEFISTFSSKWYLSSRMKVPESLTRFFVQNSETWTVEPSQTEPYFLVCSGI